MLKGKLYEQELFYYSKCYSLPNNRICSFQFSSVVYCILLQRVYFVIAFHKAILYHNIFTNMNKRNHLAGNRNTLSDSKINTWNKKPHLNYSFDSIVHTVKHLQYWLFVNTVHCFLTILSLSWITLNKFYIRVSVRFEN